MGDEMNQVIDKIAEKVGIAVEAAGPIAETMIRETVHLGIATAAIGVAVAIASVVLGHFLLTRLRHEDSDDEGRNLCILGIIAIGLFGGVGATICFCEGISHWLAPTVTLLESLK